MKSTKQHPKSWVNQGIGLSISHLNVQVFARNNGHQRQLTENVTLQALRRTARLLATTNGASIHRGFSRSADKEVNKVRRATEAAQEQFRICASLALLHTTFSHQV
jgi:hypothetical protein